MTVGPDEVIRCAVRQRGQDGQDIVNVYHFQNAGAAPPSNSELLTAVATYFDTAYNDIETAIPNGQSPVDIKVDKVGFVSGLEEVIENIGTTVWGTLFDPNAVGEPYAVGVAAPIILRTLIGKVFGRKYIGQLTEADLNGNVLVAAFITSLSNFLAKILLDFTASGIQFIPGVMSKKTAQFEPFVAGDIPVEPYYQRRRAIRHGS